MAVAFDRRVGLAQNSPALGYAYFSSEVPAADNTGTFITITSDFVYPVGWTPPDTTWVRVNSPAQIVGSIPADCTEQYINPCDNNGNNQGAASHFTHYLVYTIATRTTGYVHTNTDQVIR